MAIPDVETDITDYLDAQLVSRTKGTNLFPGPERPTSLAPLDCVFVQLIGGNRDQNNDGTIDIAVVQVLVRSDRRKYTEGHATMRGIHDVIKDVRNVTINTKKYLHIRAVDAGPIPVGSESNDAEVFAETFECVYEDA